MHEPFYTNLCSGLDDGESTNTATSESKVIHAATDLQITAHICHPGVLAFCPLSLPPSQLAGNTLL